MPEFDPTQPFEKVESAPPPEFDPSQSFELGAAQNDPTMARRMQRLFRGTSNERRDALYERETDKYDYSTGGPFGLQYDLSIASNPEEAKLALQNYAPGKATGQDKKGRWWVELEPGKKTIVDPEMLAKFMGGAPSAILSGLGTVGGAAVGGPLGAIGGGGAGGAAGQGVTDLIKAVRGNYATEPAEEAKRLGWEGATNAAFSAIAPAGNVAKEGARSGYRRLVGAPKHQEAIDRAVRINQDSKQLVEQGLIDSPVIPPATSFSPESTALTRSEVQRNIISYGGVSPKEGDRLAYSTERVKRFMQQQGMSQSEIDDFTKNILSGQAAPSTREAGEGLVSAAQHRVATAENLIDDELRSATRFLREEETRLRDWAAPSVRHEHLGEDLDDMFVKWRTDYSRRFTKGYEGAQKLVGDDPVVNLEGVAQTAKGIVEQLEPLMTPPYLKNLAGTLETRDALLQQASVADKAGNWREAGEMRQRAHDTVWKTLPEAQELRTKLNEMERRLAQPGNLTRGYSWHQFDEIHKAFDNEFENIANGTKPIPAEAIKEIQRLNKAYGQGIKFYNNSFLRQVVRDAKDGSYASPEALARALLNPKEIEAARTVWNRLGRSQAGQGLQEKISRAYMRNRLEESSEMDVATGEWVVRGEKFLDDMRKMSTVDRMVFPPDYLAQTQLWAKELAALDGKIDVRGLDPSQIAGHLRNRVNGLMQLDNFVKNDPIGALSSNNPTVVDRAVRDITKPKNEKYTENALLRVGRNTPEWERVTQYALANLFEGVVEKTEAGQYTVNASKIVDRMKNYTPKQQEMIFPNGLNRDIITLVDDLHALFPRGPGLDMSQAAASVTTKSPLNPRTWYPRARHFIMGNFSESEAFLNLMADIKRQHPNWELFKTFTGQAGRGLFNTRNDDSYKQPVPQKRSALEGADDFAQASEDEEPEFNRPTGEMRAHQPSWRDRIAATLLGDKPSEHSKRMSRELLGSTGIPSGNLSAIDATPVGMGLAAQEAYQGGDPGTAAAYGLSAMAPGLGPAARVAGRAIRSFPKTAAAAGGAAGAILPEESESAMTTAQKRKLEEEKARGRQQLEVERERRQQETAAESEREQRKLEADRQRAQTETEEGHKRRQQEFEHEEMRRESGIRQKREEADREARLPFRERFPRLSAMLPFLGTAGAFAAPYLMRAGSRVAGNQLPRQWERAVENAEKALEKGDPKAIKRSIAELKSFQKADKKPQDVDKMSMGALAASAALPIEAALLPQEYDAAMLPAGDPNREAAWRTLSDPSEVLKRAVPGALQGVPAAALGSKLPVPWPERLPPRSRSEGMTGAVREPRKRTPAKKTKSKDKED